MKNKKNYIDQSKAVPRSWQLPGLWLWQSILDLVGEDRAWPKLIRFERYPLRALWRLWVPEKTRYTVQTTVSVLPAFCGMGSTVCLQSYLVGSRTSQNEAKKRECKKGDEGPHDGVEEWRCTSKWRQGFSSLNYNWVKWVILHNSNVNLIMILPAAGESETQLHSFHHSCHEASRLLLLCYSYSKCRNLCHFDWAVCRRHSGRRLIVGHPFQSVTIPVSLRSTDRPLVVGAVTPSFAPLLLAILSFVVAAIQVIGFIGVAKVRRSCLSVTSFRTLCITTGKGHIV
jgi:hypothetical protein